MTFSPSILSAVLGPALVLALGLQWVGATRDATDARADRNAGAVVDGIVRPAGSASFIADVLARRTPRVVVVGDSLANTDVDLPVLARGLGIPADEIAKLSIPASIGAHWYALLDNLVFGGGHRPELVLVVATLRSTLEVRPGSEAIRENLDALLDGDDPVVTGKVADLAPSWFETLRVNRVKARSRLTVGLRSAAVGWLWAPADRDAARWAAARVDEATTRVFDRRQLDLGLRRDLLPTAIDPRTFGADDPDALPAPTDSFVPDLLALAQANGARLVVVRPPLSPLMPAAARDVVRPGVEAEVDRLARAAGARFVDWSQLELGVGLYEDLAHLADAGAERFTAILAARLLAMDALAGPLRDPPASTFAPTTSWLGDAPRRFLLPPPALGLADPTRGPARTWVWDVPQIAPTLDAWVGAGGTVPPGCLPLRVELAGEPLARASCAALLGGRDLGACFDGLRLFARVPLAADPATVQVAADPERRCGPFVWLYPEDEVELGGPASGAIGGWASGDVAPELDLIVPGTEAIAWRAAAPSAGWFVPLPAGEARAVVVRNHARRRLVLLTALGPSVVPPE